MIGKTACWIVVTALLAVAAFAAGQEKEKDGKKILETACTTCHDLAEVKKFKGYYARDEWQDIVNTMIKYGAEVKKEEVPVLVEYLVKEYGK